MDNQIIQQAEKPIKPCKICGGISFRIRGTTKECKQCSATKQKETRAKDIEKAREKDRIYAKRRVEKNLERIAAGIEIKPCIKCGSTDRYTSGQCKNCVSKHQKENRERCNANNRKWESENREYGRIKCTNRRQKLRGTLSKDLLPKLMVLQKGRCAICHKDLNKLEKRKIHLDHIMPLALGGSNEDYNIQLLCQTCNNKKSAKDPITYMQSLGKLL